MAIFPALESTGISDGEGEPMIATEDGDFTAFIAATAAVGDADRIAPGCPDLELPLREIVGAGPEAEALFLRLGFIAGHLGPGGGAAGREGDGGGSILGDGLAFWSWDEGHFLDLEA